MPWFRLDDGFHCHPKVLRAGNEAVGLYVRCGTYAAQQLTDGFVPEHIVLLYGSETLADALVRAGLWRRARGGWRMPDYLDYNPSRAHVEEEREKNRIRQQKSRDRRSQQQPSQRDSRVTNTVSHNTPSRPVPSVSSSVGESVSRRNARARPDDDQQIEQTIINVVRQTTGYDIDDGRAAEIRDQLLTGRPVDHPVAYVAKAIRERPHDFVPASVRDPAARTAAEAIAATMNAARGEP